MAKDTKTESKQITIQGISVSVSQPYAEGHKITDAEAKALNQVRAENIANNLRKTAKDLLAEHNEDKAIVQPMFQDKVTEYDGKYEFTLASVGGGRAASLSPVEKEARSIARALVGDALRAKGISQKAYCEEHGEDAVKNKIAEVAANPQVIAKAEANLKERESLDIPAI